MSRPKPVIRKLSELQTGQLADFFALLVERTKGATREGKPYFSCKLRDARRTATWMVWGDSERYPECERDWHPGLFFKIRATFEDHKHYGPRLDVHNIRIVVDADREDGFVEADLLEQSRFQPEVMFKELRELAESSIGDEPLRKLVLLLLDTYADKLKVLPASTKHYYPFPGGWLEHTLSVTRSCLWLAERYRDLFADITPPLNRDLVIAGAMLHEIGRTSELEPGKNLGEPAEPTVVGKLIGHVILGRDLIRDAARTIPEIRADLVQLLEHVVTSYLAIPEWGSPRLPMIPEVLILHHADDLDAKLEMYARCLRKDVSAGPFTERDPVLGKQLLKDREV
ncbi:MAG: HD domain-containing protein [Planctomycetes bacterium]|nr:HD domain-containing protein [Planctomycetota bacterium]